MMRRPALILAGVADNAMLYKDITQWLRKRTFVLLFFGLLAIAEITTALVVLVSETEERLGVVSFGVLSAVLFVYGLIIAFLEHNLTAREFLNRTFELYELSGMSLERMVWGKFLSMLVQFSFGFFCLVPFMFVAFMLGGLDFYLVITVSVLIVLAIVPMYLVSLFVALLSKSRHVSGLIRGIAIVFLFLLLPWWGIGIFYQLTMWGGSGSPVDFFKRLVVLDPNALKVTLIFLVFYVQLCLLFFYLCCNAISPSTDSRMTVVHVLTLSLTVSYLVLCAVELADSVRFDESVGYVAYVPPIIVFLVVGVASFYGRVDTPIMTLRRQRATRLPWVKVAHFLFAPGVKNAFRTLLVFYLVFLLSAALIILAAMTAVAAMPDAPFEFYDAAATALQMPFFLALPGAVLLLNRKLSENPTSLRVGILCWWIMLGIPLMITLTTLYSGPTRYYRGPGWFFAQTLGFHLSPFSTFFVPGTSDSYLAPLMLPYRVLLGVMGLCVLYYLAQVRIRRATSVVPAKQ